MLAATALLDAAGEVAVPRTLMLAAGPVDTRISPTAVNKLANERGFEWFRRNVITEGSPLACAWLRAKGLPRILAALRLYADESRSHISRRTERCSHTSSQATATPPDSTANSTTST